VNYTDKLSGKTVILTEIPEKMARKMLRLDPVGWGLRKKTGNTRQGEYKRANLER